MVGREGHSLISYAFPKAHRLHGPPAFTAVYNGRVRESRGPLTIYALPNGLLHCRLGLSVSRKVGIAVRRGRIKRQLREAFRLMQHDVPKGYDLVIVVRTHPPLILAEYQKLMSGMILKLHRTFESRM